MLFVGAGHPKVLVKDRDISSSMGEATGHWHMAFFVSTHYASWPTWSTLRRQT